MFFLNIQEIIIYLYDIMLKVMNVRYTKSIIKYFSIASIFLISTLVTSNYVYPIQKISAQIVNTNSSTLTIPEIYQKVSKICSLD